MVPGHHCDAIMADGQENINSKPMPQATATLAAHAARQAIRHVGTSVYNNLEWMKGGRDLGINLRQIALATHLAY